LRREVLNQPFELAKFGLRLKAVNEKRKEKLANEERKDKERLTIEE